MFYSYLLLSQKCIFFITEARHIYFSSLKNYEILVSAGYIFFIAIQKSNLNSDLDVSIFGLEIYHGAANVKSLKLRYSCIIVH